MSIDSFLLTQNLGTVALVGAMLVPFCLVFASVAHGWRLKRKVDADYRQLALADKAWEVRTLGELAGRWIG